MIFRCCYSRHTLLSCVAVDVKIQQAMNQALATVNDVNRAGNETRRLVGIVGHVVAEWVTWLDRAAAAQTTIHEMTSRAEMTSSRARDMLDVLVDFDVLSEGSRSRLKLVGVWRNGSGVVRRSPLVLRKVTVRRCTVFVYNYPPCQLSFLPLTGRDADTQSVAYHTTVLFEHLRWIISSNIAHYSILVD